MSPRKHWRRVAQQGVSVVEMLVGIAVGLLVALAAAGTVQMFSASQRQGMAVGGSAMNAATTMAMLKHDISAAGLGFFGNGAALCHTMNLSLGNVPVQNNTPFSPVNVTRSGGNNDTLELAFGTQVAAGATVYVDGYSDGTTAFLKSYVPASAPETVVLAASSASPLCQVRTVTQVVPSTPTSPQQLVFQTSGLYNSNAVGFTVPFTTPDGGQVALLGNLVMNKYSVVNGDLKVSRLDGSETTLVRDVVSFRVQYGVSAGAGDPTLSSWVDASSFGKPTPATITQIRAVRLGLVTRNAQREKAPDSGSCNATRVQPALFGADIPAADLPTDWACYRFRTATVVVPMRNIAFGAPPGGL